MNFPQSFQPSRGNGSTPIIGQQQVPAVNFQIQVTPDLMSALNEYANMTGLDGTSLMNYVFTRGLTAIRQDFLNAQEPNEEPSPEEGQAQE